MYTTTDLKVLELVYLQPGIHTRALCRGLKLGMPSVKNSLRKLEGILKKKKEGYQVCYYLNYAKEGITPALTMVEFVRKQRLPPKVRLALHDLYGHLKDKPLLLLLFGSYARGDHRADSDVDVFLVLQELKEAENIERVARMISSSTNTQLNAVYLDYASFRSSFHNSTKVFFKNLERDKMVLIGMELWRLLENEKA